MKQFVAACVIALQEMPQWLLCAVTGVWDSVFAALRWLLGEEQK